MASSGPKIIIKPRGTKPITNAETPVSKVAASDTDMLDVDIEAADDDSAPAASTSQHTLDTPTPDDASGAAASEGGDDREGEGPEEGAERANITDGQRPRGRGRGRPRGSGMGSGTPRARGRPRGSRGRGRGRGRGITIRLPGRTNEDGTVDADGAEGEEGAGTPGAAGMDEDASLSGGKPFRKVGARVYIIEGDELAADEDPKGNTKIDSQGNLLEGRVFKAATFTLPTRHPERMYMLAIDAARTSGFRDSLYYFRRNPLAYKLNATQPEKDHLIEQGKLGSHLRTRAVTLITARSAYKLHGAKTIQEGRWVVDDYYEDKVLEEITAKGLRPGDPVGDLTDPRAPKELDVGLDFGAGGPGGRAEQRGSGMGMYRAGGPTTLFGGVGFGPFSEGPLNAPKKAYYSREGVTEENWMHEAAQRTLAAGEEWTKARAAALQACGGVLAEVPRAEKRQAEEAEGTLGKRKKEDGMPMGVYEPHSAVILYRSDTQPARARWEQLPDPEGKRSVLGGTKAGKGAWALAWVDTVMELTMEDPTTVPRRPAVV